MAGGALSFLWAGGCSISFFFRRVEGRTWCVSRVGVFFFWVGILRPGRMRSGRFSQLYFWGVSHSSATVARRWGVDAPLVGTRCGDRAVRGGGETSKTRKIGEIFIVSVFVTSRFVGSNMKCVAASGAVGWPGESCFILLQCGKNAETPLFAAGF